ncbi:PulJ/GspJ family protein [Spiribacter vilamensis]|uniref:Prepilin-type N-terminal cleavage/methylation domain-containing protein n=1 Tax=Spiribacter vilamensis TaxID=531306 RepID=A0A4Q8D075_9GAMM|nr:hypothetical protein [Spiribacter vilamensis]RZU98610.1 hypothetical protein EV698_0864 [Spiribacter vilamensis]TVO60132.1 hypothetical protein FPL09_09875 [Spiribacter vilamensis]
MGVARFIHNAEDGVTLIEMVATITLLAVIGGFIGQPLINLIETKFVIDEQTDQEADIEYALSRVANDIRFSSGIPTCPTSNAIEIPGSAGLVEYKYRGTDFVIVNKEFEEGEVLFSVIDKDEPYNFYCERLLETPSTNLYELILKLDGESHLVRATPRQ